MWIGLLLLLLLFPAGKGSAAVLCGGLYSNVGSKRSTPPGNWPIGLAGVKFSQAQSANRSAASPASLGVGGSSRGRLRDSMSMSEAVNVTE